jgi:hypothetical protein
MPNANQPHYSAFDAWIIYPLTWNAAPVNYKFRAAPGRQQRFAPIGHPFINLSAWIVSASVPTHVKLRFTILSKACFFKAWRFAPSRPHRSFAAHGAAEAAFFTSPTGRIIGK